MVSKLFRKFSFTLLLVFLGVSSGKADDTLVSESNDETDGPRAEVVILTEANFEHLTQVELFILLIVSNIFILQIERNSILFTFYSYRSM